MEDSDRAILLAGNEVDDYVDPSGMFSLTDLSENAQNDQEESSDINGEQDISSIIYVAAVIASLGGLLFGYDIGVISGAKIQIQYELGLSCTQIELIVAMLPVGAVFASLSGGTFVDKYGRRNMIIANAVVFALGAVMISGSSTLFFLMLGRFILGFAVSLSAIAECIYISELSTPAKRGMFVSFNELAITVGILIAFLVNYILADVPGGWRIMFSLSIGIAIFQGLAMLFLPQTPQFLMIQKKDSQAESILRRLKLSTNVRQSMADMRLAIQESQSTKGICQLFSEENNLRGRMFIGVGLVMAQQLTGQPNIIYYADDVFKTVGFCTEISSTLASVGLGSMKVVSTAISLAVIDKIGRKKGLILGITTMGLAVMILGIFAITDESEVSNQTCHEMEPFNSTGTSNVSLLNDPRSNCIQSSNTSTTFKSVAFVALVTYVCAYSFGFGPITWILLSEIFPPAIKGQAMAVVTAFNWGLNFIVSATFVQLSGAFTVGGLFIFYAILCLLSVIFVASIVPETRQKSLEEVSRILKNKFAVNSCFKQKT